MGHLRIQPEGHTSRRSRLGLSGLPAALVNAVVGCIIASAQPEEDRVECVTGSGSPSPLSSASPRLAWSASNDSMPRVRRHGPLCGSERYARH